MILLYILSGLVSVLLGRFIQDLFIAKYYIFSIIPILNTLMVFWAVRLLIFEYGKNLS